MFACAHKLDRREQRNLLSGRLPHVAAIGQQFLAQARPRVLSLPEHVLAGLPDLPATVATPFDGDVDDIGDADLGRSTSAHGDLSGAIGPRAQVRDWNVVRSNGPGSHTPIRSVGRLAGSVPSQSDTPAKGKAALLQSQPEAGSYASTPDLYSSGRGWPAGQRGSALARRVPLRGGRNARPVSSGPSGPTRVKVERPQAANSPSGRPSWPAPAAGTNDLDAGRFRAGGIFRRVRASAERGRVPGPGHAEADLGPRTVTATGNCSPVILASLGRLRSNSWHRGTCLDGSLRGP